MNSEKQSELAGLGWKKRVQTKAEFFKFIADCLDQGICPTNCPEGCIVEPDGICPHNFKSVALENGLI